MNMLKITAEIRAFLLAEENITKMVERRIFPIVADDNTIGDFIVYQRDGFKQEDTKCGVASQTPFVFVTAVCASYENSIELACMIYDALSGKFTNPDMHIQLEDSTEDFIDNKYIQVLQFSIKPN